MKKLRWGILSTANIATSTVIPAMQASDLCDIAAIASRSQEKAQKAAEQLGIKTAYGSYQDLIEDQSLDAIYNPLPNHLHVPMTIKALQAGKHVLCEKPIALSADEAKRLHDVVRETGLVLAEAFMVRHHRQWIRARDIVRSGRLGDVRAIQTVFSYFLDDRGNVRNQADIGGGGLFDVGCYAINTARYIFDAEPTEAIGLFDIDPNFGTDRLTSGMLAFPGGRQLSFTCGTQLSLCQSVKIVGTQGRIDIPVPFNPSPDQGTIVSVDDGRDLYGTGAQTIEIAPCNQYSLQGDAFARAVLTGESNGTTLDDAIANMAAIDALFRSARTRQWETV